MMGGVKRHLGIMKSVQSDKGGSTGQIAGVIAFANMWFLNLANLGKQKVHPFVGFLQFLLVLLVGVEFYSNVQPEAWAPLGGGRHKPFENNLLQSIADAHQKSISQVILRWNIQRGVVVIPKSTHQQRIEENFAIWDFSLTEKEMAQISSLDLGYVGESVKHFNPEFVRGCLAVKIHD